MVCLYDWFICINNCNYTTYHYYQEKKRTYSFLTQEKIEDYLKGVICGDIDDIGTRKKIVNQFIREIVVYEDKVVITYNFTDQNPITYKLQDDINEIEKQPKERAVIKKDFRSNITSGSPPFKT